LSGSEKRIKELKNQFDSPDRYGKGLVWDGYTVHDAANVLRRYLNDLPEPVVPLDLYEKFREPLRGATKQAVGDAEGSQFIDNFDVNSAITRYQQLITELPPLNRQLLLYILDLLAVFAAKADENRMTSQNLAAIFQPGMLSHPQHAMAPEEYRLNQCVLIFLIENQDHFLIGMQGTAADDETRQEVEQGTPPVSGPATPNPNRKSGLGRSSSNASAGAESVRRDGKIRRNRSTSSRHSRHETGTTTPGSPALVSTPTGGLTRSNTVPSKKSPALPSGRFQRQDSEPGHHGVEPLTQINSEEQSNMSPATSSIVPAAIGASGLSAGSASVGRSQERLLEALPDMTTPMRERNLQSLFQRSPTSDSDRRQPNKLKKKRMPGSLNHSAQSSTGSLQQFSAVSPSVEVTNPMGPQDLSAVENQPPSAGELSSPGNTPSEPTPRASQVPSNNTLHPENSLKPKKSPPTSLHSSFNEGSDLDQVDDVPALTTTEPAEKEKEKKRRWRLSRPRKDEMPSPSPTVTSPRKVALGSNSNAEISATSIGSAAHRPRKSFTADSSDPTLTNAEAQISHESGKENRGDVAVGSGGRDEVKGPLGWIKSKYREAKENAEQRRNKSPPADRQGLGGSTLLPSGGKSLDIKREEEKYLIAQQQGPLSPPLPHLPHPPPSGQTQTQTGQQPPMPMSPSHPPPPPTARQE
jgi:GTPase-activating protein SAC7